MSETPYPASPQGGRGKKHFDELFVPKIINHLYKISRMINKVFSVIYIFTHYN